MEEAARTYPLRRPKNHKPPIPRWMLLFPAGVDHVYTAYIGVQQHANNATSTQIAAQAINVIEAWLIEEKAKSSLIFESFAVMNGDTIGSTVWVCYWTNKDNHQQSLQRLALPSVYSSLSVSDRETIGLWCEYFSTAVSRLETNYTGLDYLPGLARLAGTTTSPHDLTAYWGAARDRIPDSAHHLFPREEDAITATPQPVPKGAGQHLIGHNYQNLVHIRSGQFWENCDPIESQAYKEKLEPALETGLQYLWQNPAESGAIGVRYLRNTEGNANQSGRVLRETCAAGFFRSLGDLENWSKKHPSHLKIYKGALQHAKEFGDKRKLRTWHEVSVLWRGEATFEYINCPPETGVIRFISLEEVNAS